MVLAVEHYANMSVQYTAIFHSCTNCNFQMKKCDIFLIFAQNIDRGYPEPVLTGTHDQCFIAKIRKKMNTRVNLRFSILELKVIFLRFTDV